MKWRVQSEYEVFLYIMEFSGCELIAKNYRWCKCSSLICESPLTLRSLSTLHLLYTVFMNFVANFSKMNVMPILNDLYIQIHLDAYASQSFEWQSKLDSLSSIVTLDFWSIQLILERVIYEYLKIPLMMQVNFCSRPTRSKKATEFSAVHFCFLWLLLKDA